MGDPYAAIAKGDAADPYAAIATGAPPVAEPSLWERTKTGAREMLHHPISALSGIAKGTVSAMQSGLPQGSTLPEISSEEAARFGVHAPAVSKWSPGRISRAAGYLTEPQNDAERAGFVTGADILPAVTSVGQIAHGLTGNFRTSQARGLSRIPVAETARETPEALASIPPARVPETPSVRRSPGEIAPEAIRPRAHIARTAEPLPARPGLALPPGPAEENVAAIEAPSIRRTPGEIAPESIYPRAHIARPAEPIPARPGLLLKGEVGPQANVAAISRPPGVSPELPRTSESIPRTLSGESALRQILPSNNADLLKIARARGLNVTKETQLKPGIADKLLVEKIVNDYSPEELEEVRARYLENTRFPRPLSNIGEEAINTLRKQTYFPELKVSDAAVRRTQGAVQKARIARPDDEDLTSILKRSLEQTKGQLSPAD